VLGQQQLRQVASSYRKPAQIVTRVCLINRKFIAAKRAAEKTDVRIFQTNILRWGESAFYAHAFGMNGYVREASGHCESLAKFVATVTRKMLRGRLDNCWNVAFLNKKYPLRICAFVEYVGVTLRA